MSNILLCRPSFIQSRNDKYSIPLGLCKISAWKKSIGDSVFYVNGTVSDIDIPNKIDEIFISSVFTYWADTVITTSNYWHTRYPEATLYIGGIAATLIPEYLKKQMPYANIIEGYHPIADGYMPDYSILPTDNPEINNAQIIHTSRGCPRRCEWCGVWKIEPNLVFKSVEQIEKELYANTKRKDVQVYDNSVLVYPDIKRLFNLFKYFHERYGYVYSFCQGIDGRMMQKWEERGINIAKLMKECGVYDIRFSYDHEKERESVLYCINSLEEAGYLRKDMQVFCIINSNDTPIVVEDRYWNIYKLGCQIHSDRYRKLDSVYDNYHKGGNDYFINTEHEWNDCKIRGLLSMMSTINYSVRMGCLFSEAERLQKGKILNKGKSSMKLEEFWT